MRSIPVICGKMMLLMAFSLFAVEDSAWGQGKGKKGNGMDQQKGLSQAMQKAAPQAQEHLFNAQANADQKGKGSHGKKGQHGQGSGKGKKKGKGQ